MKDIYNMDKNLTVIRPKNTNLWQQWYLEKLSVLENIKFNPRETSPQIKITKYGNHPLCNNFKIRKTITGTFLHNLDNVVQQCTPL